MSSATATRAADVGPPPVARRDRRRAGPARRREARIGWLLSAPFVVLFAVFVAGPVLAALGMSFTDIRSSDLRTPFAVSPVGLDNYTQLFGDERFRRSLVNTAYFVVVGVPLTMVLAMAAAVALNSIGRLRAFFRIGYYVPVVTSIVAVAVVWRFLLQPDGGLVNTVLGYVGIDGPRWLEDPAFAMPSLIAMATWRNLGTLMVIFLAGLQTVPRDLLEAASVDGAGAWRRFRSVTLPVLRPVLLFGAVITSVGYLQFFEEPFVMTQGGPLDRTLSVSYYVYQQFGFGNYGYASAIAYVLFVVIAVVSIVQFRLLRERD